MAQEAPVATPHIWIAGNPVYIPTNLIYAPTPYNAGGLAMALGQTEPGAVIGKVVTQQPPSGPGLGLFQAGVYLGPQPQLINWSAPNSGIYNGQPSHGDQGC